MKNKLDHSRELDVWIWSNKPEVVESAKFLFLKMKKNKPKELTDNNIKKHLKVILTDLYVARKTDTKLYLSISLNNNYYLLPKRYKKLFINMTYLKYVIDFLKTNKYIEYHRGVYFDKCKRNSRIKATEKLVRIFRKYKSTNGIVIHRKPPIILRDKNKIDIDFDIDNIEIKTIIHNVNKINRNLLKNHEVTFNPPIDFSKDYSHIYKLISSNNKYCRIFNNSSFKQGGRFYGHWSQLINSELRKYIEIDGNPTVELDYSCLHLSMLYGREKMIPPEGDLYKLAGISSIFRKLIKKIINIAINASSESEVLYAIRQEIKFFIDEVGYMPDRAETLLNTIKYNHPAIKKYLCSGEGVHLQFIDSEFAEQIMLNLLKDNICCLCIHDSFIVDSQYEFILGDTMKNVFYDKFNFYPRINKK